MAKKSKGATYKKQSGTQGAEMPIKPIKKKGK